MSDLTLRDLADRRNLEAFVPTIYEACRRRSRGDEDLAGALLDLCLDYLPRQAMKPTAQSCKADNALSRFLSLYAASKAFSAMSSQKRHELAARRLRGSEARLSCSREDSDFRIDLARIIGKDRQLEAVVESLLAGEHDTPIATVRSLFPRDFHSVCRRFRRARSQLTRGGYNAR